MKYRTAVLMFFLFLPLTIEAETINIATGEYPPWTSESLPHGGYINHIVTSAFALSNIKVKFHYMPWKRALEATRVGQFHASSFWGNNEERRKNYYHSNVINNANFVFFYRKQGNKFTWERLQDLAPYIIGATRGYTYTEEFWDLANTNKLRVSLANNDILNLKKLIEGKIDLFPISKLTGHYLLNRHFSTNEAATLSVNPKPLALGKDFILFSKEAQGSKSFLKKFNEGLKTLKAQNKLSEFKQELLK